MPEIWLNYGITDVVLDIRAENLEQKIDSDGKILEDSAINEKLSSLDLSKPMDLMVLHNSKSTQKIISSLFTLCEQKSLPFPNVLAEKRIMNQVKAGMPEGSTINEFEKNELSNTNLVFLAEMEFDGLFGYETIATRLIRKFGQDSMLAAYAKRKGNLPAPGQPTESFEEAKTFSNNFEKPEWLIDIERMKPECNRPKTIVFNTNRPIETMFYLNCIAYSMKPDDALRESLEKKGYYVIIR